jgi:hypothetical protein
MPRPLIALRGKACHTPRMVNISIELTDEDAARLRARAEALAVRVEELVLAVVRQELDGAGDAEVDALVRGIVEKNKDLYRRLA